jgi:uroporphyrinogen decarboxylase
MKSIERVITSLQHKEPDRVPVYPILSGVTRKLVGATYEKWSTDAETCADAYIKAQEQFDLDCIVTLIDLSLEADAWNVPTIYPSNAAAHPDFSNRVINDIDEYSKI